ncbi:MAG: fumarylacetoacetate hydrolase family protein [Schleiferiaceae bacterium]|jgi:2-keto-4-pentenoate hydratase/2-oxohepta-3-ene-1,7-dioic acid hydratase in catechol pathway|tara:strand:+ start:36 stop:650 length:615 start_codon:yes stop_codon:yes gene_type:complete
MKIICIGRNYAKHAEELNNPIPQEPVVFLKPDTAVLLKKHPFFIPEHSNNIHHEIELVVKINRLGKHIETRFAHKYYSEIALGIDFTARDVQDDCKKKGLPWEKAKAFDGSAAVSNFFSLESLKKEINNIDFYLDINGKKVQEGNTKQMLFSVDQLISHVSKYFTLKTGDLIFTGTPAGVGPVQREDLLELYLEGKRIFYFNVK